MRSYPEAVAIAAIRSLAAVGRNDATGAVAAIDAMAPFENVEGPGLFAIYARGRAHLATGDTRTAVEAFEKCTTTPAAEAIAPMRIYCLVWLARARAAAGDKMGSLRAYEEFLAKWKDADPGVPLLREATAEYAKAKS
jgi:eukaryotic-like serine/threonine-protein kinase